MTSLVPINKKPKKRISKLRTNNMRSITGENVESILQALEENNTDGATNALYRTLLQTCIDLIPQLEHRVRNTKGAQGAYQLNTIINSIRELLIDIQSLQDKGIVGERIVEKFVRPMFLDLADSVMNKYAELYNELNRLVPSDKHQYFQSKLDNSRKGLSIDMQKGYEGIRDGIIKFLKK